MVLVVIICYAIKPVPDYDANIYFYPNRKNAELSRIYEKYVIQMNKMKIGKLRRTICIRLTDEDYEILTGMSNTQKVNVSKLLRNLITVVLDMVREK
jgi:hypothetical protein